MDMLHDVLQITLGVLIWTAFVAVHEGGHMLAARVCGARWAVCQIGLLQINKGGLRQWCLTSFYPLGGYVQLQPSDAYALSRTGALVFALGGIIANVALGLVLLGIYGLLLPLRPDNARPGGAADLNWLSGIGAASVLMGLVNLLPSRIQMGGRLFYSDGWHLINALKRKTK